MNKKGSCTACKMDRGRWNIFGQDGNEKVCSDCFLLLTGLSATKVFNGELDLISTK